MNFEVYRASLPVEIQENTSKLLGWCFTVQMDNGLKYIVKATQNILKSKKQNIVQLGPAMQVYSGFVS